MEPKWTEEKIKEGILYVMRKNHCSKMPTNMMVFQTMGNYSLSCAIQKNGGFRYWASRLNIEMTTCGTRFGQTFEQICCGYLTNLGYECERMTTKYSYDIVADGVKIDVKVSTPYASPNGTFYTFNLEKSFPTCDVFVAYCVTKDEEIVKTYVIPSVYVQGKTQLSIGEVHSKYDIFRDAWHILDAYRNFVGSMKNYMEK